MILEVIKHTFVVCGEPHISLLTLSPTIPIIGYYINKKINTFKNGKFNT